MYLTFLCFINIVSAIHVLEPRFNASCSSLESARICEDDCTEQHVDCFLQCNDQE